MLLFLISCVAKVTRAVRIIIVCIEVDGNYLEIGPPMFIAHCCEGRMDKSTDAIGCCRVLQFRQSHPYWSGGHLLEYSSMCLSYLYRRLLMTTTEKYDL